MSWPTPLSSPTFSSSRRRHRSALLASPFELDVVDQLRPASLSLSLSLALSDDMFLAGSHRTPPARVRNVRAVLKHIFQALRQSRFLGN
mmetsp:Transcript_2119/g.6610  ORF Transcript_2119/g.6610 Transcript_2119/m.6610 type:complete len:89 (+) Transcript_2119:553-819(+)